MSSFLGTAFSYIALISLTFLSVGCAKTEKPDVVPGVTTPAQLRSTLGEPVREWKPPSRPQAEVLEFRNGCNYQVEGKRVVGITCPPSGNEAVLQYWRHRWVGESPQLDEITGSSNSHGQKLFQMSFKRQGVTVIYDEASTRVIRVVRYAKP